MMELTVEILVHHHGAKFTREHVLDTVDAAQRKEPVISQFAIQSRDVNFLEHELRDFDRARGAAQKHKI